MHVPHTPPKPLMGSNLNGLVPFPTGGNIGGGGVSGACKMSVLSEGNVLSLFFFFKTPSFFEWHYGSDFDAVLRQ